MHDKVFVLLGSGSPPTVGVKAGTSREEADEWLVRYPGEADVMPHLGRPGWNMPRVCGAIAEAELREGSTSRATRSPCNYRLTFDLSRAPGPANTVTQIFGGYYRLIERFMSQAGRVSSINDLHPIYQSKDHGLFASRWSSAPDLAVI